MKTLRNNILLYDSSCPLCKAYSHGFIASGMLDKNGRMDYSFRSPEVSELIDPDRARNEIALVNVETKSVVYGIYSLFTIISHSFPLLSNLFESKKFIWVMKKIYAFVSYNRRVIICGTDPENPNACNPDFNVNYRIAFLAFSMVVSSAILTAYSGLLGGYLPMPQTWLGEIQMVIGQLIFQILVLMLLGKHLTIKKIMDYAGNLMTVSLMGGLLLLPMLAIGRVYLESTSFIYLIYFMIVVGLMFLEHRKRAKIYNLPALLSYTWVGYCLIVLFINYSFGNI